MSKYSYDREKTLTLNEGVQDAGRLGAVFSSNNGEVLKKDAAALDNLLDQVLEGIDTEAVHGISASSIQEAIRNQQFDAIKLEEQDCAIDLSGLSSDLS